jgi:hypothetical protein
MRRFLGPGIIGGELTKAGASGVIHILEQIKVAISMNLGGKLEHHPCSVRGPIGISDIASSRLGKTIDLMGIGAIRVYHPDASDVVCYRMTI